MKKIVLLLMALMTMGTAQESAAQRLTATVKKKPTTQKTIIAGKTTAPKKQTLANATSKTESQSKKRVFLVLVRLFCPLLV